MARTRFTNLLAGAALVAAIALAAGCGGSGGGATAATPAAVKPVIGVANSRLGTILVDSQGHTLYLFKKDSGSTSACSGECATAWPPLLTKGKATVGSGGNASLVGTITRADGATQATYAGHPLYRFIKDEHPGETNGEGVTAFGAAWFAVSPAGNQVAKQPSSGGGASSSQPAKPAAPEAPAPKPAPEPVAPKPAPETVAPKAAPERAAPPPPQPPARESAPKQEAPPSNGIPQNNGGDGDADNNGGPSDGDGNV
jgi:predicted lipoprotein with Yx(FWY)xxD motif